jgi:uncharacterized protein YgiM (DUF1202 family)
MREIKIEKIRSEDLSDIPEIISRSQRPSIPFSILSDPLPKELSLNDIKEMFEKVLDEKMPLLSIPCFSVTGSSGNYRISHSLRGPYRMVFRDEFFGKEKLIAELNSQLEDEKKKLADIKSALQTPSDFCVTRRNELYAQTYSENIEKLNQALLDASNAYPEKEIYEKLTALLRKEEQDLANLDASVERVKQGYRQIIDDINQSISKADEENNASEKNERVSELNKYLAIFTQKLSDPGLKEKVGSIHRHNIEILKRAWYEVLHTYPEVTQTQTQTGPGIWNGMLNFFGFNTQQSAAPAASHSQPLNSPTQ